MTLQQLTYFIVLADTLHYTKAAQRLFVSQPSLSRAISELEKELGTQLFAKNGKDTVLTKYGKAFLPFADEAIKKIEAGKKAVEDMIRPSPTVQLGYIYSLSFSTLPKYLEGFLSIQENRDIQFSFYQGMSSTIVDKLKKGELDIALSLKTDDATIASVPIFEQPLYLVVPRGHRLTKKKQIVLNDLKSEKYITINRNSGLRRQLDDIFETLDVMPKITFEAEECNAMASFVSANLGISIMPEIPALHSYNVEIIPMADKLFKREIHLLWVKERALSPAALKFYNYLQIKSETEKVSLSTGFLLSPYVARNKK